PMAWAGYESVDLFIARAADLMTADPRSRAALLEWVEAGGRLLLEPDGAGSAWRSLLPPGTEGDLITLDPLQRVTAGPELAALVHAQTPDDPAAGPGRLIHLTEEGKRRGWVLSWAASAVARAGDPTAQAEPSAPDPAGLRATGPLGLGMVTILGLEPQ